MVYRPTHRFIYNIDIKLLMDALRRTLFTYCTRMGIHLTEKPLEGHDGDWLGYSYYHNNNICSCQNVHGGE